MVFGSRIFATDVTQFNQRDAPILPDFYQV